MWRAGNGLQYSSKIGRLVDKDVIDVLQQTWLDGHLAAVREDVKKCDRRCWRLMLPLQVEVTKRYAFMTMCVGVVFQHLSFFRQGSMLLSRIDGPYSDAMAIVEHMRKEAAAKQV
eukprot:gene13838-13959_t